MLWVLLLATTGLLAQENPRTNIKFVDYFFENASRVTWDIQGDSIMKIALLKP